MMMMSVLWCGGYVYDDDSYLGEWSVFLLTVLICKIGYQDLLILAFIEDLRFGTYSEIIIWSFTHESVALLCKWRTRS